MLDQIKHAAKSNHREVWRWGLGAAFAIPILTFFLIEGKQDKAFMRETFTITQERVSKSLDDWGDKIAIHTEVDRELKNELRDGNRELRDGNRRMAKELDDIGDALRSQVKQYKRMADAIERQNPCEE